MADNKFSVSGDQYRSIDRKMRDIIRQLDKKSGSPLNPAVLNHWLQRLVESHGESMCRLLNEYPLILPESVNIPMLIDELGFKRVDARVDRLEVAYEPQKAVVCKFLRPEKYDTASSFFTERVKVPGARFANLLEILLLKKHYFMSDDDVFLQARGTVATCKDENGREMYPVINDSYLGMTTDNNDDCLSDPYVVVMNSGTRLVLKKSGVFECEV
jgi:hypothetical protein